MGKVKTRDAEAAFATVARERLEGAAGPDGRVSKKDERTLDPFLREAVGRVRQAKPRGHVMVDEVVERAVASAVETWSRFNQAAGPGAAYLSQREVAAIETALPELGRMTRLAVEIAAKRAHAVPGVLSTEDAQRRTEAALVEHLQTSRMADPDWLRYFPATWPENVARGVMTGIRRFADPANAAELEIQAHPDKLLFAGRGPYDLYTEVEVGLRDGRILRTYVEID
jgi:hypothetical protein